MSELRWRRVDEYHVRSQCGRFSVARLNVGERCWYAAFRLPFSELEPSTELGATTVSINASNDERIAAIRDMQRLCEAAA